MKALTEEIIESQLVNRIFSDAGLSRLVGGSEARRYGLVKRGLYVLPNKYRDYPLHPFALAQALVPGKLCIAGNRAVLPWLDSGSRVHHRQYSAKP